MRDIFIGLIIILVCCLAIDFIYTTKNTCDVKDGPKIDEQYSCGFLKEQFNFNIYLFGRYW